MVAELKLVVDVDRHAARARRRQAFVESIGGSVPEAPPSVLTLDRTTFDVFGLVSRAEATRLELRIGQMEGVVGVRVRFPEEDATVTRVVGRLDVRDLLQAIRDAGFGATVRPEHETSRAEARALMGRQLARSAVRTALPALVVVALSGLLRAGLLGGQEVYQMLVGPLLLATLAVLVAGRGLFLRAARTMRQPRTRARELPLAVAAAVAFAASLAAFFGDADPMCDVAAAVVAGYYVAAWMEVWLRRRAEGHLARLSGLLPSWATVRREGQDYKIRLHDLEPDDCVVVGQGEILPVDGRVLAGSGDVDESDLFGEGSRRAVEPGSPAYAGTRNVGAELLVQGADSGATPVLGRLLRVVEEASGSRIEVQCAAERASSRLTPLLFGLAALTLAVHRALAPGEPLFAALLPALAVLLVATPWAICSVAGVPLTAALSGVARSGVLVRDASALEAIRHLDVLVFEKSGELTTGRPRIAKLETMQGVSPRDALRMCLAAEGDSQHEVAQACRSHAVGELGPSILDDLPQRRSFRRIPGGGIIARVEDHEVVVGQAALLDAKRIAYVPEPPSEEAAGYWLHVAVDGEQTARALVSESLWPDAEATVSYVRSLGVLPMMVTAAQEPAARRVAARVGIEPDDVRAGIDTAEHAHVVRAMKAAGYRVGLVGSSETDRASLAVADVGFATVPTGVPPEEPHGVLLLRPGSGGVTTALRAAARAWERLRQNVFMSVLLMLLAVPAAFGLLPPQVGVLVLLSSVLLTGVNGLRAGTGVNGYRAGTIGPKAAEAGGRRAER